MLFSRHSENHGFGIGERASILKYTPSHIRDAWWRRKMDPFLALLALCEGNSQVTGEIPSQRPVTRSLDVLFDQRLNKRLSKQSWGWWFQTPSCSLWRHCNRINLYSYLGHKLSNHWNPLLSRIKTKCNLNPGSLAHPAKLIARQLYYPVNVALCAWFLWLLSTQHTKEKYYLFFTKIFT